MSHAKGRQRLISTVAAMACLDAAAAHPVLPPAATLEEQATAEFAMAGTAVRERLDREAAGDVIGARVAAQGAQAHRYRFLDIEREIRRQHALSHVSPSVAAARSPFQPDASFWASAPSSPTRFAPVGAGRQEVVVRIADPAWDLYRAHDGRDRTSPQGTQAHPDSGTASAEIAVSRVGDMYSSGVATPASGEGRAVAADPSARAALDDPPRAPYLVYRERLAGSDTRE